MRIQGVLTIACASFLVAFWVFGQPWLAYLSVAAGSVFALQTSWQSLRERQIDVNVLMVLAAAGAVWLGHPAEAAVLLFLFSLSNTLEALTLGKTKSAIEGLIALRPDSAIRVSSEGDETVSVESLKAGDSVRVKAFDQIPVDGVLVSGETSVNQVAMTGESVPVPKSVGDEVLAGTQNEGGMFVMTVTRASGETTLDKVVDLVQDAQDNKASGEKISSWFGQTYTFFVIGAFLVSLIARIVIGQPWNEAAHASLTLLVALSPCALVISVPASTLSALAWSAKNGVLIRGGQFIEEVGRIDVVLMDKTGTLTEGKPVLQEICVCTVEMTTSQVCHDEDDCWVAGKGISPRASELLRLAAAAEQYSEHPIAKAIVAAAREQGLDVPEVDSNRVVPGNGIEARLENHDIRIGQVKFFPDLPVGFQMHADELREKGMTVAIGQFDGEYAAFGLQDAPRPESKEVIAELKSLGVKRVVMLTGDNESTAQAVAPMVGVEEFQAGLFPEDKERIVAEEVKLGSRIMMVGDGINDAPALTRSNVGVAMGGLGSDIALNSADIVLMHDKLSSLPTLVRLGRKANGIITTNLVFAGCVMAVLSIGSVVVDAVAPHLRPLLLPFAVVGHEGSTVLVILNGLRLLRGPATF